MPPPPPPTRLTAAEAVALAAADPRVKALPLTLTMTMTSIVSRDGRLLWSVISPTIGVQWWVEVDDATGAVGEPHQAGQF